MCSTVSSMSSRSASARKPTWPRLTPSSGAPVPRDTSAPRRIVPSPPSTQTSSHPSAAASPSSTRVTPGCWARLTAVASSRWTTTSMPAACRRSTTAVATSWASWRRGWATSRIRRPGVVLPGLTVFSPRWSFSFAVVACSVTDGHGCGHGAVTSSAALTRASHPIDSRVAGGQPQQVLGVALTALDRAAGQAAWVQAGRDRRAGHLGDRPRPVALGADDAALAEPGAPDLELRLDQHHRVAAVEQQPAEGRRAPGSAR